MIQESVVLAAVIITCATTLACALNYYIMSERIVALFGFYGAISLWIYRIADNQIGAFLIVTSAVVLSFFAFNQLMRVWKPGTELKLALLEIRLLRERLKDNLRIRERASHDTKQVVVLLVLGLFLSFFFSILEGLATAVAILAPLMVILRALEGVKLSHAEVKFPDLVSYEEWDGGWSKYSVYSELAWTGRLFPPILFLFLIIGVIAIVPFAGPERVVLGYLAVTGLVPLMGISILTEIATNVMKLMDGELSMKRLPIDTGWRMYLMDELERRKGMSLG